MKKLTTVLLTGLLVIGTAACSNLDKTSANAPNGVTANAPTKSSARQDSADAQGQIRRNQLNEDIKAREQRNNFFNNGSTSNRSDSDLRSEVRDNLEANLPSSELTVEAKDGIVTIVGTVPNSEQFARIKPLAQQIKGVRDVNVEATIAAAGSNHHG